MKRKLTTNQALLIYGLVMTILLALLNWNATFDLIRFVGKSNEKAVIAKLMDQREDYETVAAFMAGLELDEEVYQYYSFSKRSSKAPFRDSLMDAEDTPQPDSHVLMAVERLWERGWCNYIVRESRIMNTVAFRQDPPWYRRNIFGPVYSLAYTIDGQEPELYEKEIVKSIRIDAHWYYVESNSIYH